jgi:biopolymer transport protein ExbD
MRIFDVSARTQYVPKIRIINLVDILFVLVLFLIATTTFRSEQPAAVKVTLPEAATAEELGKEKVARVVISLSADDKLYLDGQPTDLKSLEAALQKAKAGNPDVVLQFSADKAASYGSVVAIVDAARAAGIHNITAFTKKSVQ